MISTTVVFCLALNVYHEARGESRVGQLAVAHVTLNRSKASGEDACTVVYKPKQFSWTNNKHLLHAAPPAQDAAWQKALAIAHKALRSKDFTGGATFYHAAHIEPYWAASVQFVATYGNHHFYKVQA